MRGPMCAIVRCLLLIGAFHPISGLLAQAVTGSLAGTVLDTDGRPLSEATVSVSGPVLQGVRLVRTDAQGRFRLLALPAGRYDVTVRRVGSATVRDTAVLVHVGTTTTLPNYALPSAAVQLSEMVVSGARPLMDVTSAATATVFDSSLFHVLPTSRDFRSLLAIVPSGSRSPYGDGVGFGGSTGFENAYFVDGIHVTEPFDGNGSLLVPFNFIREVQVLTGGFEAEFGRSQGAVVNVVTNSGGNEFRTDLVGFYTSDHLRARPRWGALQSPVKRYAQFDVGFGVGGPIRRDALWFYAAYNPLFESAEAPYPALEALRDRRTRHAFAGKLSWRPAEHTDLSLTLIGDPSSRKSVEAAEAWQAPLAIADPRAVEGDFRDGGTAAALQFRRQGRTGWLLGLSLSHLDRVQQRRPRDGASDHRAVARLDDFVTGVTSGNFGRSFRSEMTRFSGDVSLTLPTPRHMLKVGVNWERNGINLPAFHESFVWRDSTEQGDTYFLWLRTFWSSRAQNTISAAYAQDSWLVSPWLRVNYGVRWEGQRIAGRSRTTLAIPGELSPRVGVVVQPGERGRHKLYATAGRFFEVIPSIAAALWTSPWRVPVGFYPQNPLVDTTGGIVTPSLRYEVDARVRGQHYDEITTGYERLIGDKHRLAVRGTIRALRMAIEDVTSAAADPGTSDTLYIVGNPGRGRLASVPAASRRYSGLEISVQRSSADRIHYMASYVLSRTFGNYPGLYFADARQPGPNISTWFDYAPQIQHATGFLPGDRRHLAKVSGSARVSHGLAVGAVVSYASGVPLSELAFDPIPGWPANVRMRGTAGRTPALLIVDFRLASNVQHRAGRWLGRVQLDVFNLFNQRSAIDVEQVRYLTPDRAVPNVGYGAANQFHAPRSARLGLRLGA